MPITPDALGDVDRHGYEVLEALSPEGRSSSTHSAAHTFVCIDGKTYWVKGRAQQGLVAELIGGRLAAKVGAGPIARIVRVTPEALPAGGSAAHLVGIVMGSEDEKDCVNTRDLAMLAPTFDAKLVDPESRALVVAFQTWIGVGDVQVLVNLKSGRIRSIDHGECFTATDRTTDPVLTVLNIPGVDDKHGNDKESVKSAIDRIESVSDQNLIDAVSRIPLGDSWRSPATRRLEIAVWLADRRPKVKEAIATWK